MFKRNSSNNIYEQARIEAERLVALEREQMRMAEQGRRLEESWKSYVLETERKQEKIQREQERIRKEQAKQAEQIAKHEKRISDLEFKMEQAESDIAHWKEQTGNLYALLDVLQVELEQAIVGGKNQMKIQKQIISLTNQIHAAESRLAKAEHVKAVSKKELEVA